MAVYICVHIIWLCILYMRAYYMAVYIQNEDNYVASLQNTEKECFGNYIKIINGFICIIIIEYITKRLE